MRPDDAGMADAWADQWGGWALERDRDTAWTEFGRAWIERMEAVE